MQAVSTQYQDVQAKAKQRLRGRMMADCMQGLARGAHAHDAAEGTETTSYRDYAKQLLQPEWFIDIPNDFFQEWYSP